MTIRSKWKMSEERRLSEGSREFSFQPVYSNDPKHENKAYWDATPQGTFKMIITNKDAWVFEFGKEYYLDISEAPAS